MSEVAPIAINFRLLNQLQQGRVEVSVPIVQLPKSQEYAVALGLRDQECGQEYEICQGRDGLSVEVNPDEIFITRASGRSIQIVDLVSEMPGPVLKEAVPAVVLNSYGQRWTAGEEVLRGRMPAFLFFVGQVASIAYAKQTWMRPRLIM